MDWLFTLSGIVMAIFGFYILGISILGIFTKRPLAFSVRRVMLLFLFMLLPIALNSLILFFSRQNSPMLSLLALMILLMFIVWPEMKGYRVAGIYDRTFREALASTMNKLNVRSQETILKRRTRETTSRIRLVEFNADLHTTIAEWSGSAQIYIEQRESAHLIKTIADGINAYYASTTVKVNNIGFMVYAIVGILMLTAGVVFAFAS